MEIFETKVHLFLFEKVREKWGDDPERYREMGLEYAAIAVVVNYAAGRGDSVRGISMDKIGIVLEEAMGKVRKIIETLAAQ